jgi:hypothetical protein
MQIMTFDREYPQHCVQVLFNVKYVLLYETTLFWPETKASFYRFKFIQIRIQNVCFSCGLDPQIWPEISDPVLDPDPLHCL